MKKFIIILLFTLFSSVSAAHIAHYKNYNKIEMEIFRNDELIGFSNFYFNREGNKTTIINQTKFSVKVLGTTIFQIDGYSEENYLKNQIYKFFFIIL